MTIEDVEHIVLESGNHTHDFSIPNYMRSEFAAAALCGIIQKASGFDPIRHAYLAVDYADALIKALETPAEK